MNAAGGVVALYGAGQVNTRVAQYLATRHGWTVRGPFGRNERNNAFRSGADVVVIATTSFLREVAPDIEAAVEGGANVITTAEEAAYPWANDPDIADRLNALAVARDVTILGTGVNPGFAFDALVVAASGGTSSVRSIRVTRVVDLSAFGGAVLRRIGVGFTPAAFASGRDAGSITGHIGFPQSMRVVAARLGVTIDAISGTIDPIFARSKIRTLQTTVSPGESAGFRQHYVAEVQGREWFVADFTGHVDLSEIGEGPRDAIEIDGENPIHLVVEPGFKAQATSAAVVANSVDRVMRAPAGWRTVADLEPAAPWSPTRG